MEGGKNTEEEQTPARNTNQVTLSDELNNWTTQRWCPEGGEHIKTKNDINNKVSWEENFIQLDPKNHNYVHKSTFQEVFTAI